MSQGWRLLFALLLFAALQGCQPEAAQGEQRGGSAVRDDQISVAELPAEARQTLQAIKQGGPFAYDRDGVVFGNFERVLPKQPRGYYHEYTVKTPGAHNRGARRIIAGNPGEYYYSADHYKTFKRIRE